jgi:hypothetical protein
VAEKVAEPAAEEEEAAERQQVGVDDPRERLLREAEGSATPTIVTSSTIMRSPRQRTIRASQRARVSATVIGRAPSGWCSGVEGSTAARPGTHRREER